MDRQVNNSYNRPMHNPISQKQQKVTHAKH